MAALAEARRVVRIAPQPGPQEQFLSSPADIVFYGGEAGGGKTWVIPVALSRYHRVRGYRAIAFRRTSKQLEGLLDEAARLYPMLGGRHKQSPNDVYRWPQHGSKVHFEHLEHEKNKVDHQGQEYAGVAFDELTHFTEGQFWYLFSRNRSTCGVRPFTLATFNPDPDSWVKKMIRWYLDDEGRYAVPDRSGVVRYFYRVDDVLDWDIDRAALIARHPEQVDEHGVQLAPTSFTFILARLSDNKILAQKDPGYRARLMALPRVERERLLGKSNRGGDWLIRPAAGLYFQRSWFRVLDAPPANDPIVMLVRAWDKAATQATAESPDPDWSRGVKMGITKSGLLIVFHVESLRGSPGQVLAAMRRMAEQDTIACTVCIWQDPAQAGVVDRDLTVSYLAGFNVESTVAREDKVTYAGPYSTQAEARNVALIRGPWNDEYLAELESFPDGAHKDQVDASSLACLNLYNNPVLAYQQGWAALAAEESE